jgi:hypothetical protein
LCLYLAPSGELFPEISSALGAYKGFGRKPYGRLVATMETLSTTNSANDIRYALQVLDEYEHLGLDDEYAAKLRNILERQIEEKDEAISCCPVEPIRFSFAASRD